MDKFSKKKSAKIGTSHIKNETIMFSGNWIQVVELDYEDEEKKVRKWEDNWIL